MSMIGIRALLVALLAFIPHVSVVCWRVLASVSFLTVLILSRFVVFARALA